MSPGGCIAASVPHIAARISTASAQHSANQYRTSWRESVKCGSSTEGCQYSRLCWQSAGRTQHRSVRTANLTTRTESLRYDAAAEDELPVCFRHGLPPVAQDIRIHATSAPSIA
eukprot:3934618-Rhodomonas_salina.1